MARAALTAPSKSQSHLSPESVRIFHASTRATNVPMMGVHKPNISKIPDPKRIAEVIVMFSGGSRHSHRPPRTTNIEPTTRRMSSKPVPGQPPANVEYKRRNTCTLSYKPECHSIDAPQYPKKSRKHHSFGFRLREGEVVDWCAYSSMIPLLRPIMAACVRSLAPSLERMLLTRLLTVSSVIES